MDEPDKKRLKMNTGDGSVNKDDGKPETDDAKIGSAGNVYDEMPKESEIADLFTDNFEIVKTKLTFVDKSRCIKNFFQCGGSVVLATAPSRFGKSTFMNMLENFFKPTVDEDAKPISNPEDGDNYKVFKNLQLGRDHPQFVKKHCGQYPVIFMSLKGVGGETEEGILHSLKKALCEAFCGHSYLVKTADDGSTSYKNKNLLFGIETFMNYCDPERLNKLHETYVTSGLKFLSEILYNHFKKKVVVLIDETDAPIMKAIKENMDDKLLKYLIGLISDLMLATLKDNLFVGRALLNSCVRLSGVFFCESRNNCNVLFLEKKNFSGVYGFTVEEVDSLFKKNKFQEVKDSDGVKKWYDGYQILNNEKTNIYNSWSVINYLQESVSAKEKMFDSYWAKSGFVDILRNLFVNPQIQQKIEELLENGFIGIGLAEPTVDNIVKLKKTICEPQNELEMSQVDFFLQLLYDEGLLTAVGGDIDCVTLRIPNWEIKMEIQRKCYSESLFTTKYKLQPTNIQRYIQALEQLLLIKPSDEEESEKDEQVFREFVNAVAGLFSDGATTPCNESELHQILFYLAYNSINRAVVMKASEEAKADTTLKKQLPRRKGKVSRRTKLKEFDMFMILGTVGALVELENPKEEENENSKQALEQIIKKQYFKFFDKDEYKHVETKIYIGLCFKRNLKVTMHYLVNTIDLDKAKFVESTCLGY